MEKERYNKAGVPEAALYAINIPISKYLLEYVDATMMAGLLYLGQELA